MTKPFCGDPGHGGTDPGAVGNGIVEKEWTLNFVKLVRAKLEAEYDARMVFARGNDKNVANGIRDDIARQNKCEGFFSIHINSATDLSANGFESFIHPDSLDDVKYIQKVMHTEIMAYLKQHGIKDRGMKTANFQVLRENTRKQMPAVLFENLFLSNPKEAALLKDSKFVDGLTDAYVRGIAKAYGLKEKAGEYKMKPDDAQKIVNLLGRVWELLPSGDSSADARAEIKRLANEVRKAGGLPLA